MVEGKQVVVTYLVLPFMVDGKTRVAAFNTMMEESYRLHHRFKAPGHGNPRKMDHRTCWVRISNLWNLLSKFLRFYHAFHHV